MSNEIRKRESKPAVPIVALTEEHTKAVAAIAALRDDLIAKNAEVTSLEVEIFAKKNELLASVILLVMRSSGHQILPHGAIHYRMVQALRSTIRLDVDDERETKNILHQLACEGRVSVVNAPPDSLDPRPWWKIL